MVRSKRASEFGLSISQVAVDLPRLMNYKRGTVDKLVAGVEQLLRARRVKVVRGEARLIRPDTLLVEVPDGAPQELSAKQIILAPGSVTADPPIEGRHLPGVLTSTEALDIDTIPARLLVIGGGVIGLEFACIYAAFGSHVTVLEMAASILPEGTEESLAKRLEVLLRRRGLQIHTGITVQRIEQLESPKMGQAPGIQASEPVPFSCDASRVHHGRRSRGRVRRRSGSAGDRALAEYRGVGVRGGRSADERPSHRCR